MKCPNFESLKLLKFNYFSIWEGIIAKDLEMSLNFFKNETFNNLFLK